MAKFPRREVMKNRQRKIRVAVYNTHPIQYYAPLWRKLAAFNDLDVTVFYGSDFSVRGYRDKEFEEDVVWDVPLLEGYNGSYLEGFEKVGGCSFFRPGPIPAVRSLINQRPDVVVLTAYHAAFWYGMAVAAAATGARIVMRHDASDEAFGSRGIKRVVRSMVLRALYKKVARFAVVGQRAQRHLRKYGVAESCMCWSPFCVDSGWIEQQREFWMRQRCALREELGITARDTALLFCGKLIPQKDPLLIFQALQNLSRTNSVHVVVAGNGPLAKAVEEAGRSLLGGKLHMLGFLNQGEIGRAYALADALVLPSRSETWGLVVNEAMQFGLPVVVSDAVGCHEDLVPDSSTGRVFQAGDVEDLSAALASLSDEFPEARGRYESACRAKIAAYSLERAASGLRQAILAA